jgi:dUTP pyrophosphatase
MRKNATVNVIRDEAKALQYSTEHSAGLDLVACVPKNLVFIEPGDYAVVPTGITLDLLPHQVAFIFPRSGLGINYGIVLRNGTGVIDADYKGEVMVALKNDGNSPYLVNTGDRIAQLVITNFDRFENVTVKEAVRGTGGFGSTGS